MFRALTTLAILAAPALAWATPADHGASADGGSMVDVLVILVLVGVAYLITHFGLEWLQRRWLFLSGFEYILLGIGLTQFHVLSDLDKLDPVIAFAAGWIGLVYGMELDLRRTLNTADGSIRLALVEALCVGAGVCVVAWWFFTSGGAGLEPVSGQDALLAAGVMGCAAVAGSSSAVDLLLARYPDTRLLPLLRRSARFSDVLAILAFGALVAIFHDGETHTQIAPGPSDWILFTVGLGVALGGLFAAFLGDDRSENSRFLALVGIIAFGAGASFFLEISALTVNLFLGLVLVHTGQGEEIYDTLVGTQKPVSLILLVFAGALWTPPPLIPALVVGLGYISLRLLLKMIGTSVAASGSELRGDMYQGLLAQGHVAVAIALTFQLLYDGPEVDLAYTAILASVIVNELIGPRACRALLVDAGDLREDTPIPLDAPIPEEAL